MKVFQGLNKFADFLEKNIVKEVLALQSGLELVGQVVENNAKAEIGWLQAQVGNFPAWEPLAESTIQDKVRYGYVWNEDYNPLWRTGDMHDSISHEVKDFEVVIGSTSELMPYHEFGTVSIPPRPVLGPAVFKNKERIMKIIGMAAVSGFAGQTQLSSYTMEIK